LKNAWLRFIFQNPTVQLGWPFHLNFLFLFVKKKKGKRKKRKEKREGWVGFHLPMFGIDTVVIW
jgi:hypothetical protein